MLTVNDKLFIPQTGLDKTYSSINRVVGGNNDHSIFLIIQGYKEASFELINNLLNDTKIDWLKLDSKIYPLVFLFRHYLEMILKDTIRYESLISQKNYSDEVGFPPSHSLIELWKELKPSIQKRYTFYGEDLKRDCEKNDGIVEKLLTEIEDLDSGSYAFRYPFDRPTKTNKQIRYSLPSMTIDILNLKNVMQDLSDYLEGINEQAKVTLDEIQSNRE
ncbi:MAG: hypothetical protein HC912_02865 [Saprospiraceae bacterium]|nr:hypothetical protein [Saprospiraceae bacterium]